MRRGMLYRVVGCIRSDSSRGRCCLYC